MSIVITGDLNWTGALVMFLEALDGGPAADVAGYAFTTSGDIEYSCTVPEPLVPADRLLGLYRCVAKTAGGVPAGIGYVTIEAATTSVRIRGEESSGSPWTSEQVTYALQQLALLEMNGASVVIPGGTYLCNRGDIEQVFGVTSVASWADLTNNGDSGEITSRINHRIVMADNYIRSVLENGPWAMPVEGDVIPAILAYNAAALAGVYLYEARGVQDYNPQGYAQHQLSYHKKNVEDFLKGVLVGSISLKPLKYSINSAAPEAS